MGCGATQSGSDLRSSLFICVICWGQTFDLRFLFGVLFQLSTSAAGVPSRPRVHRSHRWDDRSCRWVERSHRWSKVTIDASIEAVDGSNGAIDAFIGRFDATGVRLLVDAHREEGLVRATRPKHRSNLLKERTMKEKHEAADVDVCATRSCSTWPARPR